MVLEALSGNMIGFIELVLVIALVTSGALGLMASFSDDCSFAEMVIIWQLYVLVYLIGFGIIEITETLK